MTTHLQSRQIGLSIYDVHNRVWKARDGRDVRLEDEHGRLHWFPSIAKARAWAERRGRMIRVTSI